MTFTPINWTDRTTPVDASNLNRLESALSDAADSINSTELMLTGVGTPFNSGDDLNDYMTPGKYYSPNSTMSNTLINVPYSVAANCLFVFNAGATGRIIQLFFTAYSGGRIYFRTYYNEWFDWTRIV